MNESTISPKNVLDPRTQLPSILIKPGRLPKITRDALLALEKANMPPDYFVRSGALVRFKVDEQLRPMLEQVDESMLISRLARVADFLTSSNRKKTPCDPPPKVAKDILALGSWPFPPIIGIVESPILRLNGSIMMTKGYDEQTGLYYFPAPGFEIEAIPDHPTERQIEDAKNFMQEVFRDFPFKDEASRANMIGLLFTPFVRPIIDGCVPLALIEAPQAGTGKTILGTIVSHLATGHEPSMLPYSQDREEMRKKVTSYLRADANVIVIDNITDELNSDVLASALTTTEWVDRLLSRNEVLRLPQRATWIANGNNIHLGGDLPRRCYSIQLDAAMSQPWKRCGFLHPFLLEWVTQNRGRLILSVLVLIRAWVSAGKPDFSGRILGGFTKWSNIIGGILEVAGIEGFLSNLDQMYEKADEEGSQWEAFLLILKDHFQQEWFATTHICDMLIDNSHLVESLPDELGSPFQYDGGIDHRFKQKLGMELKKRVNTRYGSSQAHIEYQKDTHTHTSKWHVVCGGCGDLRGF